MILPLRVFGSSGVRRIWRGLAMGPIMVATVSRKLDHKGLAALLSFSLISLDGDKGNDGPAR